MFSMKDCNCFWLSLLREVEVEFTNEKVVVIGAVNVPCIYTQNVSNA